MQTQKREAAKIGTKTTSKFAQNKSNETFASFTSYALDLLTYFHIPDQEIEKIETFCFGPTKTKIKTKTNDGKGTHHQRKVL